MQGGGGGARTHPLKSRKGPPDEIVKDLKWYKTNVAVVGLTIWMHFQQFEDLKFLIFTGETCLRTSLKPLQSVQLPQLQIRRDCLDCTWESRLDFSYNFSWDAAVNIPILKISSHKPTSREIYFR